LNVTTVTLYGDIICMAHQLLHVLTIFNKSKN